MAQYYIIDPTSTSRATIAHQISQFNLGSYIQLKSYAEAKEKIEKSDKGEAVVLASIFEGISELIKFVEEIRKVHTKLSVIAIGESVSFENMRLLIGAGIDQILIRPFNANQLKDKIEAAIEFRRQVNLESEQKSPKIHFEGRIDRITGSFYKVALKGYVAENCVFPEIEPDEKGATLFVDLDYVRGFNSVGIRSWLLWLKAMQAKGFQRFEFENLRSSFLSQANMIQGVLPPNSSVNSFFLFYWCEELGIEREFRFSRGKDYATDVMRLPRFIEENFESRPVKFELDQPIERYLKFYPGKIEVHP